MLKAIVDGLEAEIEWPSVEERRALGDTFEGIFKNCIGIVDCWERPINKFKDTVKERDTYSGKKKNNTKKVFEI